MLDNKVIEILEYFKSEQMVNENTPFDINDYDYCISRIKGYEMMDKQVNSKISKLPSKELLSEVLSCEGRIQIIHHMVKGQTTLYYAEHISCASFQREINIYELAHKCKEWANVTKGVYLSSGYDEMDKKWEAMMMKFTFVADTEPEAIFKACEYILKNKDKK